ncbi:MAG: porin [Betaproteobacteria bacterium]|nr:porin [Betaproteobacteria bacterium]
MKKTFVFTALATAALACSAQTSVTAYGILDVGVSQVSGYKGGSVKMLSSGIMDGTRLGFRGTEDLGGGWRALFTAEARIEADNGTSGSRPQSGTQLPDRVSQAALLGLPNALQPVVNAVSGGIGNTIGVNLAGAFWDRQIFVGLVTPVGAILAGRQYTPAYEINATFDTLQTQSSLAAGQVASIPASVDIRLSNSLAYRIQLGGFSAALMAAAGEGSTSTGKFLGANAMYKTPAFSFGVGYNTRENEKGAKSLTSTLVGATVALGPGSVSAMYGQIKDSNPTGVSGIAAQVTPSVGAATAAVVQGAYVNGFKQDGTLMHVGYKLVTGPNTFYVAYTKMDDKRAANADTVSYGAAYSYALSKRTDINAVATRFVNSGLGQAAPGAAGYLGGVTAKAGDDSTSLALGVRHRF